MEYERWQQYLDSVSVTSSISSYGVQTSISIMTVTLDAAETVGHGV